MHHSVKCTEILLGTSSFKETLNNCHFEPGKLIYDIEHQRCLTLLGMTYGGYSEFLSV